MPLDVEAMAAEVVLLVKAALAPVLERLAVAEARLAEVTGDQAVAELTKDVGSLRERVAVVELRALQPGPPGEDGQPGTDGLGFDDLAVQFDGDRTVALTFTRGGQTKSFPVTLPFLKYCGVFADGTAYDLGDVVTWAGSSWHCKAATRAKPGEGSRDWQLVVKRGRDGRDGRDAYDVMGRPVGAS